MAYRMTEITETIRAGRMEGGDVDIEVWPTPYGWRMGVESEEPQEFILSYHAAEALFDFLRQ